MIIYGKQVSLYLLQKYPNMVKQIYISKKSVLPSKFWREFGAKIKVIENRWAQSMSRGGNHQGILLDIEEYPEYSFDELKDYNFLLILDSVTDAGNIGAIIRSAYALGVDGVILGGIAQINFSSVARTSAGALFDIPVVVKKNTLDIVNELKQKGFTLYGASMEGEAIEDKSFDMKRVLVMGSEDKGISKRVKERLNETVSITMRREFDSLNVSAAAAILIHRMGYAIQ